MKTLLRWTGGKVAGTLRVPSARGPRPRQIIEMAPRNLRDGWPTASACCFACVISLVCLILTTGCGLDGPVPRKPQTEAAAPASPSAESKPAETEKGRAPKPAAPEAGSEKSTTEKPTVEQSTTEQAPGTVREKAHVGMGEKGRGYGGGMITESVHVLFTAREKIVLDQMQHALDLYKVEHDGKPPKTKEEFMDKIIKENNLRLPTLPQGESYVYDPNTGDLLVQRPANN